ncbi:MAG: 2-(1,2-epoxy-1,2-dihydrophenyl)acetyl-CoA isomerase [Gammaproteobacteria bacterium]|nr:MAG: 2-(1,2-epoxy-1,2-dihydrophenyl)acetyl-CoA isomerase [Gammaproteobacteria bacterium]UCH39375.1 MAG: 2-(1,2-epoxy-1,2-dihydrophenyl)acetyl-CoA isomerase [Gammaproteobacteria bacterium]
MNFETIEFAIDDGVARLTLNRPDKLNSFNAQMHQEVREVIKTVHKDDGIRCLLLGANGRGFCAGQDLSERNVAPDAEVPDLGESLEQKYNPLIRSLTSLEKPVVCAVNGVAAGAGANIALACDIVLAAESARFIQSFCNIGLVPDSGGTWILPRLVGHARAMGLALLGERLSARQAEEWGLIWKCIADDDLAAEAERLAKHLATRPTHGLGLIKRAMLASNTNTLDQQLDLERDLQRLAGRSEDYREGVAAFIQKRDPEFRGC